MSTTAAGSFLDAGSYARILESYTGVPAREVVFSYGPFGKPGMTSGQNPRDLRFSVSHTPEVIVYVFGLVHDLGVDIEPCPPARDIPSEYSLVLSPEERLLVHETPEDGQAEVFLTLWTRKEACLKTLGRGFSLEPSAVDVSTPPSVRIPSDIWEDPKPTEAALWVCDFRLGSTLRGAIASTGDALPRYGARPAPD